MRKRMKMIIATPSGKFFSEAASERDGYKWRLREITEETATHYCQESQDYIVFRGLTWKEKIKVLLGR